MRKLVRPVCIGALLLAIGPCALAACPEKLSRDPTFLSLAVEENAPRPKSVDDFSFIGDTTTITDLTRKIGPPDGAKDVSTLVYCLPDGSIVTVISHDGSDIREVRVGSKRIYKRK